ncbi:MAG: MFS transporter [Halobacteriota archaeon]
MKSPLTLFRRHVVNFGSDDRAPVLLTLAAGWFFTYGIRLTYPVMVPQIRAAFDLSNTVAGGLFTVMLLTYASGQFPSGIVADRIGERFILLLSLAGTIAGVSLLATAPVFAVLLFGCVLFGVGSGLYASPTVSVLSKVYSERAGTVHGIVFAAGSVGTTILPFVAGYIVVRLGWRIGFAFVLPALVLTAVAAWQLIPESDAEESTQTTPFSERIRASVRGTLRRDILLAAVALVLVVVPFQAISSFLPTYFIETKGLTQQTATLVFSVFFASGFLWQVGAGILADRWSMLRLMVGMASLTGLSLYALTFVSGLGPLLVATLGLSVAGAFISVTNTYFVSVLPDDVQGGGLGLLRSVVISVGASGPIFFGLFADAGRFDFAFRLFSASVIAAVVVLGYSVVTTRSEHAAEGQTPQ